MKHLGPIALFAVLGVRATPALARTPEQEAKELVASAMKAHEAGDFPKALADLQAAFDKDPQPELLYAIAQVEAKLDNCPRAIEHYEQFLNTSPSAEAATDTREAIAACRARLPPPVVTAVPAAPPPVTAAGSRAPLYRDPVGISLISAGAVASIVGVVLYVSARGTLDDAEAAANHALYEDLVDDARTKRALSVLLVGGGGALIAGGVTRLVLRDRGEHPRVSLVPSRDGALVTWDGGW